jgi:predicted flavoprotein YhiN
MKYDVIVIGAEAGGLMCAAQASYRGRQVLLIDKAHKAGKKI